MLWPMMGEAALSGGFHVRQLAHERRHFIQLVRPDGQVILQPLNHVQAGLHRFDELGLRHRRQLLFDVMSVHAYSPMPFSWSNVTYPRGVFNCVARGP
ncbi:hypothetical protein NSND_50724 [Nitrospira sp. ND1]|nr:hypothetical protein NSND_50724 [Nitrospira sp. ND1]